MYRYNEEDDEDNEEDFEYRKLDDPSDMLDAVTTLGSNRGFLRRLLTKWQSIVVIEMLIIASAGLCNLHPVDP